MDGYVTIGTKLDTDGLDKGLTRLENGLKSSESKMSNMGKSSGKKFGAAFLIGFSLLTSVIGKLLTGFANSIDGAIKRVDILNNFPKVMQNLGQSAEDSQAAVDYLSKKLEGLPTTLDSAVGAVQRFTSANNNVKASTEMFLALNNALLASGAPMSQQQAALEQLSQAYAKGKPDMMEWRTAMSAMPAQLSQVAQVMGYGKNGANALGEALRSGEVSMNDFMVTLVKMNHGSVNGIKSLEEQARTGSAGIQTSIANLKTAFVRGMAEILQTIGQTNITNFFNTIIAAIKAVIPYIAAFVRSFIVAVNVIGKIIGTISRAVGSLFGGKSKKDTKDFTADVNTASVSMKNLGGGAGTTSKNLGKAAKAAKEVKKQLAGFDEMNILQDNKAASTGGGGGGAGGGADVGGIGDLAGVGDFGDFGLGKLKDTLKELNPLTEIFTALVWGLIAAFAAFKILNLLTDLGLLSLTMSQIIAITAGIGLIVAGVVLAIQGVLDYLENPTWQNFLKILAGIALVAAGLLIIVGSTVALIVGIVLLIAAIGLAVYKNWDKVKAVLATVGNWIKTNVIDPVVNFFVGLWESIKSIFAPVIAFYSAIISAIIDVVVGLVKTVINYVSTIVSNIVIMVNNIKQIIGLIVGFIKTNIISPIATLLSNKIATAKAKIKAFVEGVKSFFSPLISFFQNFINKIKNLLVKIGTSVGNIIGGAFKGAVNGILRAIETILNAPINAINGLIGKINKVPGVNLTKLNTFNFPRLAKGGIVNMPGQGIPIGSAIAGERGAEGVIPLTDSQQMALLGEAIGRYITVNANITNMMNGRVISRELQKIQNDNDFAFNR